MVNSIQDNSQENSDSYSIVFKKIKDSDIKVNPFKSYKLWNFSSGSATSSLLSLFSVYTPSSVRYLPALGTNLNNNISNHQTTLNGKLDTINYYSIDHLFYKRKDQPFNTFGGNNLNKTKKYLYQSASILSFPQNKVGLGIKPESFTVNTNGATIGIYGASYYGLSYYGIGSENTYTYTIQSDRYGNLYDASYDTGSIVTGVMWYEGFNEYFDTDRISYESSGVEYVPGIVVTTGGSGSVGLAAKFSNGYIRSDLNGYYDRNNNFAISFFISASNNGISDQLILGKLFNSSTTQYPFKIELSGSDQIKFTSAAASNLKSTITSSATITDWTHVVCQKSGSYMQMYINGTLHSSLSTNVYVVPNNALTASGNIHNSSSLYLGGFSTNSSNLTGVLDEVRIFNKCLTTSNISALADRTEAGTFLQTNHVGNIFHEHGIAVISSPHYRYNTLAFLPYVGSYRSTVDIHELSVLVRVDSGEYNMSLNPTLTADNDISYLPFVSGSDFSPYITTIGLYDDYGRLLAIGKLAQPIKKRSDVDMNFLIRIDLDKQLSLKPSKPGL
jgi:hypothetical protein